MADLASLLKRSKKGAAAEGALAYLGEEFKRSLDEAKREMRTAFYNGDPNKLWSATAKFLDVDEWVERIRRDVADGEAAGREIGSGR